jgi:hypothetical protein
MGIISEQVVGLLSSEPHQTALCSPGFDKEGYIGRQFNGASPLCRLSSFLRISVSLPLFIYCVPIMAKDLTIDGLAESILNLVRRVEALLQRQAADPQQRVLVALAGVPGSGKSTVSHALLTELASRGIGDVAVVPMVRYRPSKTPVANKLGRMASITPSKYYRHSKTLS